MIIILTEYYSLIELTIWNYWVVLGAQNMMLANDLRKREKEYFYIKKAKRIGGWFLKYKAYVSTRPSESAEGL
jgi:hypothetical protein